MNPFLLGGLAAGAGSLFSSLFGGGQKKDKTKQLPTKLPHQAPYLQQYENEILPMISQRFAGMGTGASGLNSSGFQNTLAESANRLQTNLAGLRSGLGMQAANSLYGGKLAAAQTSPFENIYQQGYQGGQGAGNIMANLLPFAFMNMGRGNTNTGMGGGGSQYPLSNYYDQQFRVNPGAMGY